MNREEIIKRAKSPYLALTGRIKDWALNPEGRLPVSCTVFSVEDSLNGRNGIMDSWVFTGHGLQKAAGIAVDLSKLRPEGHNNGRGLIASGVPGFAPVYSTLNEKIRRGGVFKNGAVTLFLDCDHPDMLAYLKLNDVAITEKMDADGNIVKHIIPGELPWAKRAVYISPEKWDNTSPEVKKEIAKRVHNGEVWLAKIRYDADGNRLRSNVCLEVLLPHRGTCLLAHHNLGMEIKAQAIPKHMRDTMELLCELHAITGVGETGHYLSPEIDKQVGMGVIGLSNLLAIYGTSYREFTEALEFTVDNSGAHAMSGNGAELAYYIYQGYQTAADVAKKYGMERAFAIAPTASCAYRYKDYHGYVASPEISPPLRIEIDRDSDTFGVQSYTHHPDAETAINVGFSIYWRLCNAWQRMQESTGLGHAMSVNLWTTQPIDIDWIENTFMPSDVVTTYYRLQIDQEALDKSEVVSRDSGEEKLRDIYYDAGQNTVSDVRDTVECQCG